MDRDLVRISELAAAVGRPVSWLRRHADRGDLPSVRTEGGHRRFNIDEVREALGQGLPPRPEPRLAAIQVEPTVAPQWHRQLALIDLEEHVVWRSIADDLSIAPSTPAGLIVQYAFTEMLNNATDHSGGTTADVAVWRTPDLLSFRIVDDGEGVFQHLKARLGLPDDLAAIPELTKGKRTTMPERHTGEGIFFTSKAVDIFQLSAAGLRWTVDNLRDDQAVGISIPKPGTTVFAQVDQHTRRELREVFENYTRDHEFVRTRPVIKLFTIGLTFISRSEAKRLVVGLEGFSEAEIDFGGVTDVGQGFVDELFRVWPSEHPGTQLTPVNMNPAVEFMVKRALAANQPGRSTIADTGVEPPYGIEP